MKKLIALLSIFVIGMTIPFAEAIGNPRVPRVYPVQVKRYKK